LTEAFVKERGLQYDRRWMLVDDSGRFITQREYPIMAGFSVEIDESGLNIGHKLYPNEFQLIPFEFDSLNTRKVSVWESDLEVVAIPENYNNFFSEILGTPCTLVFMNGESLRNANRLITGKSTKVSLADAYPYLIISEASLEDLNLRLKSPVEMKRFRPNLVIKGCEAYKEDTWKEIRIGHTSFKIVKPCPRCVITTINPEDFKKSSEPLSTLATYRKVDNVVNFGMNAIAIDQDIIRCGDEVQILS